MLRLLYADCQHVWSLHNIRYRRSTTKRRSLQDQHDKDQPQLPDNHADAVTVCNKAVVDAKAAIDGRVVSSQQVSHALQ